MVKIPHEALSECVVCCCCFFLTILSACACAIGVFSDKFLNELSSLVFGKKRK